ARPAIEAVEQGKTRFVPEQWTNTYMAWMRNIHDWCISRQLWWGHQIPAWYCPDGHVTVARQAPAACATCGKQELRQDEDVLDTWFSSALWPFSTMGWPERTETLRTYYPTSVMETGHDIIFFWVARMMMMGIHFMGEVPFRTVYLHPMVRDEKGQKMSKTKGNVIDPLVMTERYGADALRFTLAALTAQGRDIKLSDQRIEGYRAFANKLWNASRFALMNLSGYAERGEAPERLALSPADRWILARLQGAVNETVAALEAFRFNDAAGTVYQFVWHELCDWYIELAKDALYGDDPARKHATQAVLVRCLETTYRLLHPFMPFITEELWHVLRARVEATDWADSAMAAPYPQTGSVDRATEAAFGPVIGIVDAIRNIRGEMGIPFKVKLGQSVPVEIAVADGATAALLQGSEISRVHRVSGVETSRVVVAARTRALPQSAVGVGPGFEVRVPLAGVIDLAAETARADKEIAKVDQELAGIERKLANPSFVQKAPPEVVEKDRARAEELREKRGKLEAHRAMLSGSDGNTDSNPARRDSMENQNEQKPGQEIPAPGPAATQPNPVMETAEKVAEKVAAAASAASEVAQQAVSAVTSGVEAIVAKAKAVRKAVRKPAKKKVARKAKPARKAAKRKPAKKKAARKPARKAAKRKVARRPARKAARRRAGKRR
ncbi:MAG TPA: class I tRNA ligase family protein, partial [Anaeromyxobacter sp.]|nr:class I tRNA ligase family protein [Anaeromyxobacter sp.]